MESVTMVTLVLVVALMAMQLGNYQTNRAYTRAFRNGWERQWKILHQRLDDIEARLPPLTVDEEKQHEYRKELRQ